MLRSAYIFVLGFLLLLSPAPGLCENSKGMTVLGDVLQQTVWGVDEKSNEKGVVYEEVVGILERNPKGNEGVRCWNDCMPDCRIVDSQGKRVYANCSQYFNLKNSLELPFGKRVRAIIKEFSSRPVPEGYMGQVAGDTFPGFSMFQRIELLKGRE